MNEDEMEITGPRAGAELERTLERYARVRLDPGQASTRRARAAVMEEAWRLRLGETATVRRRRGLFSTWSPRRIGVSLAAAVLAGLVIGSSTFAASRAGGVLYETRIALEILTLPAAPDARLDAEIAQTRSRLADVVDASARADQGALDAALTAYEASVGRLTGATGSSADRALEAVRFHRSILLGVLDGAPAAAVWGLDQALARSDAAIDRLQAAGTGAGGAGPNAGGASGGSAGSGGGSGSGGGTTGPGPATTPRADRTTKPDPTAKPAPTPRPERTAKPDRTPKPTRSPAPGGPAANPDPGDRADQSSKR